MRLNDLLHFHIQICGKSGPLHSTSSICSFISILKNILYKKISSISPFADIFKLNNAILSSLRRLYLKVLQVVYVSKSKSYKIMR